MTELAILSAMATRTAPPLGYIYIKEWMDHLGISDAEMAERLGIDRSAVWKRYREQNRLDRDKIKEFADAMGLHPLQLNYPPGIESLDALTDGIDEGRRREIVEIVKTLARKHQQTLK